MMKMIVRILKKIKILFVLLPAVLLLLYCEDSEDAGRDSADRERQQSKTDSPIRVTKSDSTYGRYSRSDYEGPACNNSKFKKEQPEEYAKCRASCKIMYSSQRSKCEKLPIDLITKLSELFDRMKYIRAGDDQLSRSAGPLDFGVMIDIHPQPILNLIKGWSDREVTEFLIWTAKTGSTAEALRQHDQKDSVILKSAFKRAGGGATAEPGMASNLQGQGNTFLTIAEKEKNISAFVAFHNVVKNICSRKNCKLYIYCAREEYDRSNIRTRRTSCHYSTTTRPGVVRVNHCYAHGPNVWNYWETINKDRKFYDSHFTANAKISEAECDKICTSNNCQINN